jgi:putative Ig domain-containing protein
MAATGTANTVKFHRKHGKLYYNIKSLAFDEDLIVDENGVPDATQNPDAVFIGGTDAGYTFLAEPTIVEETYDEVDAPYDVGVDAWNAHIDFDALEVVDIEKMAALQPGVQYSENTDAGVTTKRVTAGGSRVSLAPAPVAVISKEKSGGYIGAVLYKAYNSASYSLQFKKTERSKQPMVIKGLSDDTRQDGDQIWRSFVIEAALVISTASPLPGGDEDVVYSETLAVSGGVSPYTWSVSSGTLPAGLTLSSGGVISGTPTTAGSSTFTVEAEDSNGATKTKEFTLVIDAAP